MQAKILNAANMEVATGAIYDAGVATNSALQKVSLASYDALTNAVEQRLFRANQRLKITIGAILAVGAFALGLAVLITRSLARPLHHAISVFGRISAGHYENEIRVAGTDEASQVLLALNKMPCKARSGPRSRPNGR